MVCGICIALALFTRISQSYVMSLHGFNHVLTTFQTNVLVHVYDGRAYIGGFGTASIQSTAPTVDGDRSSFHGTVPKLIDAHGRAPASHTGATMANDVYAFAVLAWEVRVKSVAPPDQPLNGTGFVARFSLGSLHSLGRTSSQRFIQCRMDADRLGLTTPNSLIECGR